MGKRRIYLKHGPFLELSYYIPERKDSDSLRDLALACLAGGAMFSGKVTFWKKGRSESFASVTDFPGIDRTDVEVGSLGTMLDDQHLKMLRVYVENPGSQHGIITYTSLSAAAATKDWHPVTLLTDGDPFSDPANDGKRLRKRGREVYEQFFFLLKKLNPGYAAISCEIPLPCPTDLKTWPDTYVFQDFYVSRRYVGDKRLAKITSLFSGAFIESIGEGTYISCTPWLNPSGKAVPSQEACSLSCQTSRMLSSLEREE